MAPADDRETAAGAAGGAALGGAEGAAAVPRRAPAGGRRRRAPGGRHRQVQVRVTDAELAELAAKAAAAGVSMPRYLVECALDPGGPTPPERRALFATLLAARRTLAGAANNLNQLTRLGNIDRRVPAGVDDAAAAVAAAAARLSGVLEEVG